MPPHAPKLDEDEEDFFQMLENAEDAGEAKQPVIQTKIVQERISATPPHHFLHYDSDQEAEPRMSHTPTSHEPDLVGVLSEFYSKYNFNNLDRVPYLADKFNFRRWELWEQLSIKYRLSPTESRLLWIDFCVHRDGIPECARQLFQDHEAISIPDDSGPLRKAAWRAMLGIHPQSDQRELFEKYISELAPRGEIAKLTPQTSDIARDVERTHQELAFFQDPDAKISMTQVLTVYTTLNGIKYVQGMNEILAVVYYTMRDESDAFWGFTKILAQLKDIFTAEADTTHDGIYSRIDTLAFSLNEYDYKLAKHFTAIDFPLATLAMRWVTTLLAMDITLPDALRVWDVSLQSNKPGNLLSFSICLSLAYLISMSSTLLEAPNDQECVEIAAHFGKSVCFNVDEFIVTALSIYAYESILRGRYHAASDEPVIEAIVDAVGSARDRIVNIISGSDALKARDDLVERVNSAKSLVSGWLGSMAVRIPSAPASGLHKDSHQ